jgi:hypothetical protein
MKGIVICQSCGTGAPRRGASQKYCQACSIKRDLERKAAWSKTHFGPKYEMKKSEIIENGRIISGQEHASLLSWFNAGPNLLWLVRVSVPFDWSASKNHMFTARKFGHVALKAESRAYRDAIGYTIKSAMRNQRVVQNKVWIDIFIQKPNQRGDAANFVDLICDAIKEAIGIDDRWFSIRRLDWQIVKDNPRIFIGIGQDTSTEVQACSSCGRLLDASHYHRHKGSKVGMARNCHSCLGIKNPRRKAA